MQDTEKPAACSGVILAGGLNSRMGGRNKAFLEIGGRTILDRLLKTLRLFFTDILLVTRQPEFYDGRRIRIVTDIHPARSSLTGIHAGLVRAGSDFALIVPCDTPFLKPDLIRLLLSEIEPAADVIVPVNDHQFEPLCAIYSKRCLPFIEAQLSREDYRIFNFFNKINLKTVPEETLRKADPDLVSFYNVNTPEAYRTCGDLSPSD